jgi:hypothetical protein
MGFVAAGGGKSPTSLSIWSLVVAATVYILLPMGRWLNLAAVLQLAIKLSANKTTGKSWFKSLVFGIFEVFDGGRQ